MVSMKAFEALGRHLARQQARSVLPGSNHERLKAALLAQTATVKPGRTRARLVFGLAAALSAAGIAAYFARSTPRDLTGLVGTAHTPAKVGAWMSAPLAEPLNMEFSDGTHASLWPQARARVTRLTPFGADLVVEQGRASFSVVHRALGHWQVSTGPFVVQVTGTRFDVEWRPESDRFELALYEGQVRVTGCALGEGQDVSAGHRLEVSCARSDFRISALGEKSAVGELLALSNADPAVARPELTAKVAELQPSASQLAAESANDRVEARRGASALAKPSSHAGARSHAEQVGSPPNQWTDLAREGRFANAYDMAFNRGFDAECLSRSSTEVLLLGDSARLSGHLDRARQAYQAARRRWPGSVDAAMAAFQMGRTEFDQRRDYAQAEGWLRAYLTEQPNGDFAAPAMGRLMEAEIHLGRYDSARGVAESYLDRYPKGSHADAAHQVLAAHPANAP